ncbi:MAG: CPBP family intramembrane metalloprotease [Proteobacteria bacterium]|nr:MAG: CPBP family intramembrane metalloprotease [Pseudomonadota bacterium]
MEQGRAAMIPKPGAWVDLGLTLPIFLAYHLGVVFLRVRNGSDFVTGELLRVSENNQLLYLLFTSAIGVVFAGGFAWLGRGHAFRPAKFLQIAVEGVIYAVIMRLVGALTVQKLFAGRSAIEAQGPLVGAIMSMGAGFYEELAFRVILFGAGAKALVWMFAHERMRLVEGSVRLSIRAFAIVFGWSVVSAMIFSGVHYVGALGDSFELTSFVFRFTLGMVLTLIFTARGFAAAVWAHTVYDVWVLVF